MASPFPASTGGIIRTLRTTLFLAPFLRHFQREATVEERQFFEDHYVRRLQTERAKQPEAFQEVPGASDCWRQLEKDERFVLGIATGGWRAPALVKLQHVGIHPAPPYAAYADGMEQRDHILQAAIELARQAHQISHVVYIGDAIWDVTTTRQMNLPLIGLRRQGDEEVLRREGVKVILRDYKDVATFYSAVDAVLRERYW